MDFKEILNLKEGGNYTLINTLYDRPRKREDGKYDDGLLTLLYKDNQTGKLLKYEIEDPLIEAYRLKPEYGLDKPELYIEKEKVEKVDLSYAHRARDIAKMLGPDATKYYYDCIKSGNRSQVEKFIKYKDFFSSDVDIEDFYRIKTLEYFGLHVPNVIGKGYLDIEVDIIKDKYFDVENSVGEAPINAVTIVNARDKQCFTLLLRDDTNPQIQELEDDIDGLIEELEETFGSNKWFKGIKYAIKFFDEEIDLIKEMFNIINYLKLDFMMIWNMRFDIRYIINRITGLGYDPHEIMTSPEFKSDTCYFILDRNEQSAKDLTKRSDDFICASYTKFIDQMLLYAQVRKAKALPSYKLDAIGEREIHEGKVSYADIGNIATFPMRNYRKFVIYNIKDVLIQYGIEEKVKDVDFMFHKAYEAGTRYLKCFKETIYNRNLGYIYFKKQGQILGNNQNVGVEEKKEKYEGAVVDLQPIIMVTL